jgi:perosamine synthetase
MALFACLKILGLKEGQEVIIPSLTFVATANAIIMAGGIPVCVDITEGFNLNTKLARQAINENTFGIMPVHLYGHFTNVYEVKTLCDEFGIIMIEDASQGVGVSDEKGNFAATIGAAGVLSFYGNKFVTSAQGGMIVSSSAETLSDARRYKNHGRKEKGTFWHEEIGFNFCTSDLNSSLGVAQLKRFDEIRRRKHRLFDLYQQSCSENNNFKFDVIKSAMPCYWFISVFTPDAEHLSSYLRSRGIQSRRAFPPLSMQPCYSESNQIKFYGDEEASRVYGTYLSLPSSATLGSEAMKEICSALNDY